MCVGAQRLAQGFTILQCRFRPNAVTGLVKNGHYHVKSLRYFQRRAR